MIGEKEALARILAQVRPLPAREIPLVRARNAFVTRDIFAAHALPHFDNSSMDGYALVAEAAKAGARFRLIGEQPAGLDRKLSLQAGEAIRILTGAPIPEGADAVIMQEETTVEDDVVIVHQAVEFGQNIRRRGGDIAEGQNLFAAGERLRAQGLALLAAQGIAKVEVGGSVRAAVISTGDELVPLGAKLRPGQIYDSNAILLQGLLESCGADIVSVVHCNDRAEEIEQAVRDGVAHDALIITGGVSVGARDFVKPALSAVGASLDLWRVAVKPGKPFLFGHAGDCAIFGLPGNPVSAFVTFLLFVRPALLKLMGANDSALALMRTPAQLADAIGNSSDRPHYVRGILDAGRFVPVGRQESHALFGLSRSNALLRLEAKTELDAHAAITALTWD